MDESKIIWIYWQQGWENAPLICIKCLSSWYEFNPTWTIRKLDSINLSNYIDLNQELPGIQDKDITATSLSDIIRICLLEKHGGLWVDATVLCRRPIDEWLPTVTKFGFFAFANPTPERLASSWFLFAEKNNAIISKWKASSLNYWKINNHSDNYFWFHYLFNDLYKTDNEFKNYWDGTPKVEAAAPHIFVPYEKTFSKKIDDEVLLKIESTQSPLFKLTYKFDQTVNYSNSILSHLLNNSVAPRKIKLLIAWYGSFNENGTTGDYLSVSALSHYLKENNYSFDIACYKKFDNIQGNNIRLEDANQEDYNVLIFCCGPILKQHENLQRLFKRFEHCYKIGIGVSMFNENHFNYFNPFDFVLARENASKTFEDIAILANLPVQSSVPSKTKTKIGLVLRNAQGEYGIDNCKSEKANTIIQKLANDLTNKKHLSWWEKLFHTKPLPPEGEIVVIDNHLHTSGRSPEEIENEYASCDLIITTRFHGTMMALRNQIPVIAIDQIKDGAKVFKLVSQTGYPFVWKINKVWYSMLKKTGRELIEKKHISTLLDAKSNAQKNAKKTLEQLNAHLIAHTSQNQL